MKVLNYMIAGFTVKRIISYASLSAAAGLGTGKCWRNLQEHPGTAHKIIGTSFVGGAVGGIVGLSVGLWAGHSTMILVLTQSMYGSLLTGCYCNIHSLFKNSNLKLPTKEEPLNDVTISVVTGGLTGSIFGLLPGMRVFYMGIAGLSFGFFGHFIYKQLCILRLEFLIRENYPELYQQLKESEKWMEDQRNSNPYYAGPVKPKPDWMLWLESLWGDFGKRDINELRRRFSES